MIAISNIFTYLILIAKIKFTKDSISKFFVYALPQVILCHRECKIFETKLQFSKNYLIYINSIYRGCDPNA